MRGWARVAVVAAAVAGLSGLVVGPAQAVGAGDPVVLAGTVRTWTGVRVPNVQVSCRVNGDGSTDTTTDAKGQYYFHLSQFPLKGTRYCDQLVFVDPTGRYALQYYPGVTAKAKAVAITFGATTTIANANLSTGSTLTGKVTDSAGRPLPLVNVTAYLGPDQVSDWPFQVVTGPDGSFTVPGLPAGSYRVGASAFVVAGYTPSYAGGSAVWASARGISLAAGTSVSTGAIVLPTTRTFYTSAPPPVVGTADGGSPVVGETLDAIAPVSVPSTRWPTYYWFVGGKQASGGSWSYTIQPSDVGKQVVCVVVRDAGGVYADSVTVSAPITVLAGSWSAARPGTGAGRHSS